MNTSQFYSTIRNSIYERYDIFDRPVLYREVNIAHSDAELINSQSRREALIKQIKIELPEKYQRLQKERREQKELEITILKQENENIKSHISILPIEIINFEIFKFL